MTEEQIKSGNWKKVGSVSVDSGQVLLVDPCYLDQDFDSLYQQACDHRITGSAVEYRRTVGPFPVLGMAMATCVASGVGDGQYPVYAQVFDAEDWGYRIGAVMIDFFPGE